MSFRVKLRIKSVKPHIAREPAPIAPHLPPVQTDSDLLRKLYEVAKMPVPSDDWHRRWLPYKGPGLPDPRLNPTCTLAVPPGINWISWNGGVQ